MQCLTCHRTIERERNELGAPWRDTRGRTRCDRLGHRHVPPHEGVRWIMGRVHVGTPRREVIEDLYRRARANDGDGPALRDERKDCYRAALHYHERNRAEYAWVMGSH